MKNTIGVCQNNNAIANDYYRGSINNTTFSRSQIPIFRKKKGDITIAKEASERRYNNRKNVCCNCFQLMQVDGNHECE